LRTGKQVGVKDLFTTGALPRLLAEVRKSIRRRENDEREKNICFTETIDTYREIYDKEFHPVPEKIAYKDLNGFFVTEKGVTFLYDYNFAHVVEACEPDEQYFFTWGKLKPFIKSDGLLAKFVR
jgi:hypothetical protein